MTPPLILSVEDNPADRAALRHSFQDVVPPVDLAFADSADAALILLRSQTARPQMMLVDVNMPGRSGLDLLSDLKDRALREIPVWMLSGSLEARDVKTAYARHACGFLKKPADPQSLRRLAETLSRLCTEWLTTSQT